MRTLVIEDDHSTARSIEMMLARAEFIVYTAALGTESAELAKLYEYD